MHARARCNAEGRDYLHGILAQRRGSQCAAWDPSAAQGISMRGSQCTAWDPSAAQGISMRGSQCEGGDPEATSLHISPHLSTSLLDAKIWMPPDNASTLARRIQPDSEAFISARADLGGKKPPGHKVVSNRRTCGMRWDGMRLDVHISSSGSWWQEATGAHGRI